MKAQLLIVEDEAVLYERLRSKLSKANYSVDAYTPSVEKAIESIKLKRPDLVLLDIDLQGQQTGLDLGKKLTETYKIPFIYVTNHGDDHTFYQGLNTNHDDFMVKTKPRLDVKELLRKIQTVLQKSQTNKTEQTQQGVMGLVAYLDEIKELDKNRVTRVPIDYSDILFFTVKPFINEDENEEHLRPNYLWFCTKKGEYFFLKSSLRDLQKTLPYHFVRINESYILNISQDVLDGRINGSKLCVGKKEYVIKSTYKSEVQKRLEHFYGG